MPSFCVVANCEYKYASSGNISFHKFPLNSPELLKQWINFADRGPQWTPSKWSAICGRHFLPSDFRNQILRKCLKRTACPSVTIKSLDFNSIPTCDFNRNQFKINKIVCRLCARTILDYGGQSKSILELSSILMKCFPTTRLETVENFPNQICGDCIKKLMQFSLFVDRVTSVQRDLFGGASKDSDDLLSFNDSLQETAKPMIIKQEPIANIKQEIFEFNKSSRNTEEDVPYHGNGQDFYADTESDAYCEFCDVYFNNNVDLKNHIVDLHSNNPRERANNCEIMEIITLENPAFIDLAENCADEPVSMERVLKVEKISDTDQRDVLIQNITNEHNYAITLIPLDLTGNNSIVRNLKQEETNAQVQSLLQADRMEMVLQSDAPLEPTHYEVVETEQSAKCDKCNDIFDSSHFLNEHLQSVHMPKTKICPICTAHCKTVYHYFIHRSRYHNWSKPRRVKKKIFFKCADCSKTFTSKFAFDNHVKFSCTSLRFKCSICQLQFDKWMSMQIHKRKCKVLMRKTDAAADSIRKCRRPKKKNVEVNDGFVNVVRSDSDVCGQSISRRINVTRHQQVHTCSRDESSRKITNCGNSFDRLNCQKRKECSNVLETLENHSNIQKMCSCCKTVNSFSKFKTQKVIQTLNSLSSYVCETCNKGFRVSSNLYQHRVTHDNERKHQCTMCTKVFKRLAGLNQHIRGYHYQIKPHVCAVCKHSYALKGDMTRCRHSALQNKT